MNAEQPQAVVDMVMVVAAHGGPAPVGDRHILGVPVGPATR
ncbi:hypothetical protein [Streptosporangium sp. NPDC002524]